MIETPTLEPSYNFPNPSPYSPQPSGPYHPKMGNKLSSVHGVKSEDYYQPGNAINEIWVGNVEIISLLPFGDSDKAQAGWKKIPWHNFIIPMKRDAAVVERAETGLERRSPGGTMGVSSDILESRSVSLTVVIALSIAAAAAFCLPVLIHRSTPVSRDTHGTEKRVLRRRSSTVRAGIATASLILGLVIALLNFHTMSIFGSRGQNAARIVLEVLCAAGATVGSFCSAGAVCSIWTDWRESRRWWMSEDCRDVSDSMLIEQPSVDEVRG